MEKRVLYELNEYLEELKNKREVQEIRLFQIEHQRGMLLIRKHASNDRWYYYVQKSGEKKQRYIGVGNNSEVNAIKELRYLDKSVSLLSKNIKLIEKTLKKLQGTDYVAVNERLPDTYRWADLGYGKSTSDKAEKWKEKADAIKLASDVFRAEDLKVRTNDGSFVRSKSEAMIYNYLHEVGATFAYELPMRVRGRTMIPDFTILSEIDHESEIILEHQGMMDVDAYRNRFADKVQRYLREGFTPGVNVFFTFDNIDGGFDMRPIEDIIRLHIKAEGRGRHEDNIS